MDMPHFIVAALDEDVVLTSARRHHRRPGGDPLGGQRPVPGDLQPRVPRVGVPAADAAAALPQPAVGSDDEDVNGPDLRDAAAGGRALGHEAAKRCPGARAAPCVRKVPDRAIGAPDEHLRPLVQRSGNRRA